MTEDLRALIHQLRGQGRVVEAIASTLNLKTERVKRVLRKGSRRAARPPSALGTTPLGCRSPTAVFDDRRPRRFEKGGAADASLSFCPGGRGRQNNLPRRPLERYPDHPVLHSP